MASALPAYATITEISELAGIGREHVRKHIRKAKIESVKKKYPLHDVLLAIHRHRQEDNRRATTVGPRAEKIQIETDILRVKLDQMKGDLIPASEVKKTWSDLTIAARAKLLSIPTRLAASIVATASQGPAAVEDELRLAISEALEELARDWQRIADDTVSADNNRSGGATTAAAGAKRKSVGRKKPVSKRRKRSGTR